ncbi:rho GTPase-activating protein 30 isoform X2 [Channa argus]|uniref:rho GTPase-activating protein 30 isoform X2 n=1 Tax=Channa argus TaxID=215402 RepID=UPI00352167A8
MRRVRRRGGNKEKVFGCDLLEHLTTSSQEIPQVLRCCSEFVEQHGIVDGIYRLSGVSSNIQKLRGEFEIDSTPDLNKDLYLQDIHCVSSLCKAYFRELPNPLLTYQLYDKFAEAVAIQLEEERLVKIRDVLKELPTPHYRTLEFLMRHLVRMASYSSETNMHARNLAIVWAPNLLRSKDIEASGFNGTAAFMEVRVQSIVVEFILTHVPQLFPEQGVSNERRKSLPSPSAISSQEDVFFKSMPIQPLHNFGNISPGDGPLAIRPYHAIIEGTDKRKGSLKGKKWMSIFNIGGRFHDPRRKHKHSSKEKERPALRPARSMDSLSTPSYPNEGSRRPAQRPPSISMSPAITPCQKSGPEATVSAGAIGGSEYAVTYRRGTGLVSGGAGTQGTYTALDPEGLGIVGNESIQTRSPGLSTKMGRRAAMHITGPTMVTVPLHITSNLALGVLQGGGGDRVIHRARDKDGGDRGDGKEGEEKVHRKESNAVERKLEEGIKVEEEEKNFRRKEREGVVNMEGITVVVSGGGSDEGAKEKEEEELKEDCRLKPEELLRSLSREQEARNLISNVKNAAHNDQDDDDNDEYMVHVSYTEMKGVESAGCQPGEYDAEATFDASGILNSTEAVGEDQELSGYVQDNFEFLDQLDCSAMDHMDCSMSYQMNEFSVEPPGHSDEEYEMMIQSPDPMELQSYALSPNELNPHRPLSLDLHSRHTKSLSLPYMTSPVHIPDESSTEEEEDHGDDIDENNYSSDEDESMFVKSLPPDFFLNNVSEFEQDTDTQKSYTPDRLPTDESRGSQEGNCEMCHVEESNAGGQQPGEVKEAKQIMKEEEEDALDKEGEQPEKHVQSTAVEDLSDKERPPTPDMLAQDCEEFPPPPDEDTSESSTVTELKVEEEKQEVDNPHRDYSTQQTDSCGLSPEETGDFSEESTEHPRASSSEDPENRESDEEGDRKEHEEIVAIGEEMVRETGENVQEEPTEDGSEEITDNYYEESAQEDSKEQGTAIRRTSDDIWDEVQDAICEMIEDKESELAERDGAPEEGDEDREEQEEEGKTDFIIEVEEESEEAVDEKVSDPEMHQEFEEKETLLPKTSEEDEGVQEIHDFNDEAQHHHREEVNSKEQDREPNEFKADEQLRTPPSPQNRQKEFNLDVKKLPEHSAISHGGVGRKLVVSKSPKVYQAKAVPVVPPKPQHCKITAQSIRQQQQQQRERRDGDRGRESPARVPTEQDRACAGEHGRDGGEARDRNSPVSMCFDVAVAIATMKREKEKECEKERQREWGSEAQ